MFMFILIEQSIVQYIQHNIQMLQQLLTKIQQKFPYHKKRMIQNYDFILIFEQYYKYEIQTIFTSLKCKQQIEWTIVDNPLEHQVLFLIKISDKITKDMAHELKILKKKNKRSYQLQLKDINKMIYLTDPSNSQHVHDYLCFLRARMGGKNREIYEQERYSAFNKNKQDKYQLEPDGNLFTPEQQLRAKYHFLLTYTQKVKHSTPDSPKKSSTGSSPQETTSQTFSTTDIHRQPFTLIMKHPGFTELVPIQKVSQHRSLILGSLKKYVGPNIDCYFQFVTFFQKWLIFPMIIGLLAVGCNTYYDYTADNSPFDFIYALFIMLWSILFITRWEEMQKWTKVKESGGRSQVWTESQSMISKRDFQKHYSLVTGKVQYHLSLKLRILISLASNLICIIMMLLTLTFIIYSLNARGFIDPTHKLFYSETVSSWASNGGIFDSQTFYGQIPNIIHVMVTNGFDENIYRPTAKLLAKIQRHESRKGYQNSIILKYFVYQFVITFADLFYIAFVRFDIQGLREQLLSLFFIDIIRRVVAQTLIPWLRKNKQKKDSLHKLISPNTNTSYLLKKQSLSQNQQLQWSCIHEINKDNYEPFDDYLQIISNFGYLVMLSSCFPLAPLLILIAHQVQLIQDKYKVIHIAKRKLPQTYVGMGRWKNIVVFICYFSIVTNIMLFAFSSQQVVSYFPKLYEGGKDLLYGNTDISTLLVGVTAGIIQNTAGIFDGITDIALNNITDTGILDNLIPQQKPDQQFILNPQIEYPSSSQSQQHCNGSEEQGCKMHPPSQPSMILQQFRPPSKDSEVTFMAILFFIQHFFLLLFICIRDVLKRRKSEAEIFLERRDYKRRIKKNLPKNILDTLAVTFLVTGWIQKQGKNIWKQREQVQKQTENRKSHMTLSTAQSMSENLKMGSSGLSLKQQ